MCLNLVQACTEGAASKRLLRLMSIWIQRGFGMTGIPLAAKPAATWL